MGVLKPRAAASRRCGWSVQEVELFGELESASDAPSAPLPAPAGASEEGCSSAYSSRICASAARSLRSARKMERSANQKISPTPTDGARTSKYGHRFSIDDSAFRLQKREENGFANTGSGEQHHQPVDPQAQTAHRRGAVFQGTQKIVVELHRLI